MAKRVSESSHQPLRYVPSTATAFAPVDGRDNLICHRHCGSAFLRNLLIYIRGQRSHEALVDPSNDFVLSSCNSLGSTFIGSVPNPLFDNNFNFVLHQNIEVPTSVDRRI